MSSIKLYRYEEKGEHVLSPLRPADGIPFDIFYQLIADGGYVLTADNLHFYNSIVISEQNVDKWYEVEIKGQKMLFDSVEN